MKLADENTRAYRARATKAEQEVAEWKARFDALLMRTPKLEGGEGTVMAETLKELVKRLDKAHHELELDYNWSERCEIDHEWPRLRDSILAMREELERVKMVVGEVDYDIIEALLARLDNPEPVTFGSSAEREK